MDATLRAVSLNSSIWGGIYNPIVPLIPKNECTGLLTAFDPDVLVDLTGGRQDRELQEKYEHRILQPDDLVSAQSRTGKKNLTLGINILPLLQHIYDEENIFLSPTSRVAIVSPDEAGVWSPFVSFVYGSFAHLPQADVDFPKAFLKALRAQTLVFDPTADLKKYEEIIPPIQVTGYDLQLLGGSASLSSHIIYCGDHLNWLDLVEFWNIRATGRTVAFVPVHNYQSCEHATRRVATAGHYPINPQIENDADLQKAPSISEQQFTEVCDWITGLGAGALSRRTWRPRFGISVEWYVGDIHVADTEAETGEEMSILEDSRMTPVKLIAPAMLGDQFVHRGDSQWSVEIQMRGGWQNDDFIFSFPREPEVEKVVSRSFLGSSRECRLGRNGVVISLDHPKSHLYLSPVRTKDVFGALFKQVGLETEPSLPGKYMEQIIRKMGSLQFDCRLFKLRGVRDVINRLSNGSVLTKGNMYDIVMSTVPDKYGQNWRPELYEHMVVRTGQKGKLEFGPIFDELLAKRVVRPGLTLTCQNCFASDWYHVSEFTEEYVCRFCFSSQRVNFGSKHEWQFRADGLFQIENSALGSIAGIAALWRLEEVQGMSDGRYLPSVNLRESDGAREYEIDYAYLIVNTFTTAYNLVLGQAKNFIDFTEEETKKMAELAQKFANEPYLVFSTLKDAFSDSEKALLKALVDGGCKVVALTRLEIDPYYLYDRFEHAPNRYANSLEDLSQKTLYLNLDLH